MNTTAKHSKFKQSAKVKDESFNVEDLQSYNLYLNIGFQSLEFCIVNNQNNKCIYLEEYKLNNINSYDDLVIEMQSIWDEHAFLNAGFWKKVRVAYNNQNFTFIPSSLFNKENKKDYLDFSCDVNHEEESIAIYKHISFSGVNVFSYSKKVDEFLTKTYPKLKVETTHQGSSIIEAIFRGKIANESRNVLLNVEGQYITIVVSEKNELIFSNRFFYTSAEDFIYYILFIYKELKLDTNQDKLMMYGEIAPNSPLYDAINKYIRHSSFGKRPKFLNFSYHFDEVFDHKFQSAYAIHLCE